MPHPNSYISITTISLNHSSLQPDQRERLASSIGGMIWLIDSPCHVVAAEYVRLLGAWGKGIGVSGAVLITEWTEDAHGVCALSSYITTL